MQLVDAIGSESAMSTVGLELSNLLNPDLTWKTVSKGNRSATRRTRKAVARNFTVGMEPADTSLKKAEDSTVSESDEKLGVAVLGRRFSDKIEHVPIKKRKHKFRSPSPPPRTPSPCSEVVQHPSDQGSCPDSDGKRLLTAVDASSASAIISPAVADVKIYEEVNGKPGYREDFSGIDILATAACNNSFDVVDGDHAEKNPLVEKSAHEENDPVMLVEQTVASMETDKVSPKDSVIEERMDESSLQDTTTIVAQKSPSNKDDNMVERPVSLRDDRLHWDLNVVMDAWEEPCDIVNVDSQTNDLEYTSIVGSGKLHVVKDSETERETKDVKHDSIVGDSVSLGSSVLRGLPYRSNIKDNQLEAGKQVAGIDACLDNVPFPNNGSSKMLCVESVQVQEYDVVLPCASALDKVSCDVNNTPQNDVSEDFSRASSLHGVHAPESMTMEDNLASVSLTVAPTSKADEVVVNRPSPRCEDVCISSAAVEFQPVIGDGTKALTDETISVHTSEFNSSVHIGFENELMHVSSKNITDTTYEEECRVDAPTTSLSKNNIEDSSDDINELDTSQADKVHIVGTENTSELQAGYDSQFEDGELREPDVRCWEENDGDGVESEQLDYGSEPDGSEVEDTENKRKFESRSSPGSGTAAGKIDQGAVGDDLQDYLTNLKKRPSRHILYFEDGPSGRNFTSRLVGSRTSRRDSLSCMDAVQRSRSDNFDDSNKYMGRDRSNSHMHRGSPGDGFMVNIGQSPTYYGPYGPGRPKPRSGIESRGFVMASDAAGAEGFENNRVRRQYLSSSSNSDHRPFHRRPLAYKDDIYGFHTGAAPVRDDISPDRSRFRRYPRGAGRGGFREDYRRPMPNYSTEYNDHMPHRLGRRGERSISPLAGERLHYAQPYKKSGSRSRSRSPNAWLRNEGSRRRSRSPNFRSNRMDRRVRLPFQKRFVAAEFEEGFISPTRNRFSPQRNSRTPAIDNFRDRKSPVRMFRQHQRFDSGRPGRPMTHPRRFPVADMGGGAGRGGFKYEGGGGGDDDRRKPRSRYEMMNRVKQYDDVEGPVPRLRYNEEEAFVAAAADE